MRGFGYRQLALLVLALFSVPGLMAITISPSSATLLENATQQFTASANATWTTTSCGTITSAGLFTAGLYAGTCSVTAKATDGSGAVATAAVTIASPVTMSPTAPSTPQGSTQQFSANAPVTWRATNCGSIDTTGLFTASASVGSRCTILATASSGPRFTVYNYDTVIAVVNTFSVTPANPNVPGSTTLQFSATSASTWTASCGTITSTGLFTAPLGPGTCTVTATATDGSGHTASSLATITSPLTITPASTTVPPSQTQQFTASLPSTWTASCGSITTAGLFAAPASQGSICTITAVAATGPAYTATATATIGTASGFTLSPAQVTVSEGGKQQFTASAKTASWTTTSCGTISSTGLFTALLYAGKCSVTAKASGSGLVATAAVTITSPIAMSPVAPKTPQGLTQQFTATAPVVWRATNCGSITQTGLFTASAPVGRNCTILGTAASGPKYTVYNYDTIIAPGTAFSVSPLNPSVPGATTQQFSATAAATWQASCGSISPAGLFTAPLGPGSCTVTATATDGSGHTANTAATITSPLVVSPVSATTAQGQAQQFTANLPVNWTASCGSIASGGLFTASATPGTVCTITGTASSGPAYTAKSSDTVGAPLAFTVSPAQATVAENATQQFTSSIGATWAASCGSINGSGLFTAPLTAGACTITAAATDGSGHTANSTATITSPLVVSPASATTAQGQTQQFSANMPVNWVASCGGITGAGMFTASAAPGSVCNISATASSGPAYTSTAADTIGAAPALTVSPAQTTVAENATQQFTANIAATWAASCGSIDASGGLFTAPLTTGGCTVTATASDGTGHTATAMATVTSPLVITPASATTGHGAAQLFTANQAVNWTSSCGGIDATGLFTASASQGTTCTVTATASSGTAYTATASDTVGAPVPFTVSPAQVTVAENATQQFTATAPATWTVDCGSIDANAGLFTAGLAPGTCNITATATDGSGNTATAATKVVLLNYTTRSNDLSRTGSQRQEYLLTPANVNATSFGSNWSQTVDNIIWGQPLYMNALTVNGAAHNVVFVTTTNDSVYAFDADNGALLWQQSFLSSGVTAVAGSVIRSGMTLIGIVGTPVIDPDDNTMYVVAFTAENGGTAFVHRLHALDITTGLDKVAPVVIAAPNFTDSRQDQRAGLLLANGRVYVSFGGFGDIAPYQGFVFAYRTQTLAAAGVFNNDPTNPTGGGIWMAAAAPAADAAGNIYVTSGNGGSDGLSNFGQSVVKLSPDLNVMDYFTPFDNVAQSGKDVDLGSGGVLLVPDQNGAFPHEMIVCGKPTPIYVLNRDQLGQTGTTGDNIIQRLDGQIGATGSFRDSGHPCFMTPTLWNQNVYFGANHDVLKMFTLDPVSGLLSSTPTSQGTFVYQWPGTQPVISSNGDANGIVWTYDYYTGTLRASDATDLTKVLYVSPGITNDAKFQSITVINGHVYVAARAQLYSFTTH